MFDASHRYNGSKNKTKQMKKFKQTKSRWRKAALGHEFKTKSVKVVLSEIKLKIFILFKN